MERKSSLKKFLNELDKEDLIEEIEKLNAKFDVVKKYFLVEISGDALPFLNKAKKQMLAKFWTKEGRAKQPKISALNKISKEFEQVSIYKEDLIELYIFRVEESLKIIPRLGYLTEQYAKSVLRVYDAAQKLVQDERMEEKFGLRCQHIDELMVKHGLRYDD